MASDLARIKSLLAGFQFKKLFIEELGWEHFDGIQPITVDAEIYQLKGVAYKRGMYVFICPPMSDGSVPDAEARRKIERAMTKVRQEHLVVFVDRDQAEQRWQWVRRIPGKPLAYREFPFRKGQSGELLAQKLNAIKISFDEEEKLTLPDVTSRARGAFDVERVTKRFYEEFRTEHDAFKKLLDGIPDGELERWYVSVMLNRLMFVYFIQRKGLLGGDQDYLRHKLDRCKAIGKDLFYLEFICPLFFEGFAMREQDRTEKVRKLLGDVPYLNGGIFAKHQIEELHGKEIRVPDRAFDRLFAFFDKYQWHLDERPVESRHDYEINPDVLGYIFEKYINQKQMGAYYTKEDITGYISRSTIIPFLLDATKEKCKVAFEGERSVWRLLADDPDRYIFDAVRRGADRPLPSEIKVGIQDVAKRSAWNRPAVEEFALPTEIWREVVARRQHYETIRAKMVAGEVRSATELITCNLDVLRFAQDVVEQAEGPDLLAAIWEAISRMTVLDPTCGSGAFLFAALNILDPLYEACLDRMAFFLAEWGEGGAKNHPQYQTLFSETLRRVDEHPNHRYFVLKSIVVNNIFGVDIMEEAVEICKLRLFLKLVAQVDKIEEPLPDIDFNIRSGNSLVGFVSLEEVRRTQEESLGFAKQHLARVERQAIEADAAFGTFREMQTEREVDPKSLEDAKSGLKARLRALTGDLDEFLAREYSGGDLKKDWSMKWRQTHQPFHWLAEFYGILRSGGFDVIIGNPPYLELSELRQYGLRGYECIQCGNLYAPVLERCASLGRLDGRQGFIVPVSSISTERYASLQKLLGKRRWHYSSFDDRPSRLFDGLEHIRLTIHILGEQVEQWCASSTRYNKWSADERAALFEGLRYTDAVPGLILDSMPKLCSALEWGILEKLRGQKRTISTYLVKASGSRVLYSRKVGYFLQVLDFEPKVIDGRGKGRAPSEFKELAFRSHENAALALGALNSSLFYWFITVYSDCRHVNKREVESFPVDLDRLAQHPVKQRLMKLGGLLMKDLKRNSVERRMKFSHDTLTVQCIIPKHSKEIIDQLDASLAEFFGFSSEELDYLMNYDVKFGLGLVIGEGNDVQSEN